MSFSETEKLSIGQIVGMTPTLLDAHLLSLGDTLTEAKEDHVRSLIEQWDGGIGNTFTSFTPTESNKGFNLKADSAKRDISRNIRLVLEIIDTQFEGIGTICTG